MPTRPTEDELAMLKDVAARRKRFGDQPFKLKERLFDKNFILENYALENTEFEACDFMGSEMTGGRLKNVRFIDCLFVANRLDEGEWEDVSFTKCAGRGPVLIGAPKGKNLAFSDCEFVGATSEEVKYGGITEQYGGIGGTDGTVQFSECRLTRMFINGGSKLAMKTCTVEDVFIQTDKQGGIDMEAVVGKGKVDFGNGNGVFGDVRIHNSSFAGLVSLDAAEMKTASISDTVGRFRMASASAESVAMKRVTFTTGGAPKADTAYGLHTTSANIGRMLVEQCQFEGERAALHFSGERPRAAFKPSKPGGRSDPFTSMFGELTIKGTPVRNADLKYTKIGTLTIESTTMSDTDLSNSAFKHLVLRDVTLKGNVDYTATTVGKKTAERVNDTSRGTPPKMS